MFVCKYMFNICMDSCMFCMCIYMYDDREEKIDTCANNGNVSL